MTSDDIKDLPPIIDQFLNSLWLEDGLSKNTLNSYRYDLKQLVACTKIMILFSFRKVKFRNTWPFDFHIQNQEASQDYSPVSEDFIDTSFVKISLK